MSETLFKFLLSEITAVRVLCQHQDNNKPCNAVIEVPLARLSKIGKCPVCGNELGGSDHLFDLRRAMQNIIALDGTKMRVELVLPADKPEATSKDKQ